jgi:hypothetical protein
MQETKELNLQLSLQEVNYLLQMMGDMPTKSGVYNLMMKIHYQSQQQLESAKPKEELTE